MRIKKKKTSDTKLMLSIWRKSQGDYFCVSSKTATGKWNDKFFKRNEMPKAQRYAESIPDRDVYMGTHGYSEPRRHKDVSIDPCLLYADLDEADPRQCEIKPTIAIESSPGRYVGYWLTDEPASEDLNRRLTYFLDADPSGWDRTQVLRVPGTYNHKYEESPRVRILWTDGPRYEIKRLNKLVPDLEDDEGNQVGGDVAEIYKEYEKKLPRWARTALLTDKVERGKRSEVLWKLLNVCVEIGMTRDEAFTICWHSPWNKHADRRNGEAQMENELDKAIDAHMGGSMKKRKKKKRGKEEIENDDPTKIFFEIKTMDQVEVENVDWLVPSMFARKEITIIEGDPGVGKSYFLQWVMIHHCEGNMLPWVDKKDKVPLGKVLYCDLENSAGSVTKVRLVENGMVHFERYFQFDKPFSVDSEESWDAFLDLVERFEPDYVVVDPINLYIGGTDTYRSSETQQALTNFKNIAVDYNCSVVIVRHLTKSSGGGKALYAGQGSIAFTGAARIVATVGWHPEEADMRVVACTKNNLSAFFGSFGYTIEALPDTLKQKNRSRLIYEGSVSYDADDIIGTSKQKDDDSANIASDLVRDMMEHGEVEYKRLVQAADGRSISERSLKKAILEMGLKKVSRGRGKARVTLIVKPD